MGAAGSEITAVQFLPLVLPNLQHEAAAFPIQSCLQVDLTPKFPGAVPRFHRGAAVLWVQETPAPLASRPIGPCRDPDLPVAPTAPLFTRKRNPERHAALGGLQPAITFTP